MSTNITSQISKLSLLQPLSLIFKIFISMGKFQFLMLNLLTGIFKLCFQIKNCILSFIINLGAPRSLTNPCTHQINLFVLQFVLTKILNQSVPTYIIHSFDKVNCFCIEFGLRKQNSKFEPHFRLVLIIQRLNIS